ncbi:CGNR zinc finger domain-containing protein [Amycolatopsis nalaikhensis]|uniref:ABATE domain-containing protein n=1 Tax=Amycolatopsis nalaikhensis TaxID=715472 RepID=A0ABY8XF12_9PSEU|nr:ABATE domain-containing protein [Amycolatopsis sp. 2-2]WIV54200.1 ABATE domain-containing protein [Amycolatopsis sp. 2-2]
MRHAFPCGDLALDFAGTRRGRRDPVPREMLRTPADLDVWFVEAGVADRAPGSGPDDLADALTLREAVYALVRARLVGDRGAAEAVAVLNRAAARPSVVPQLGPRGRTVEATAGQALSSVARAAVAVLGGPEAALLRECGRPGCTQVYVDTSRGSRREWCAMATCGNKMKALAHRARLRGNPPLRPSRLGS